MNIYATGMNPVDSNALKREPRVSFFQAYGAMINFLKRQNHDVTWKATKVGDEFPRTTQVVMVSSMLPRSLNCPYALGVMWAISEALKHDIPLVVYLTDWAFFRANGEFKSIAKAGEEYFFKTIGGAPQYKEDPAKLRRAAPDLLDVCRQYNDPNSKLWKNAAVLVPKYTNWGNMDIVKGFFKIDRDILPFDPTPIFIEYLQSQDDPFAVVPMEERYSQWILPSLLKDDTWIERQGLRWPVQRFGPKGFEVMDSELAIQNQYRYYKGAICPPYPTEGSGWWRSRWIHAALAETVLLCGPRDAKEVGSMYTYTGREYEAMSPSSLQELASGQSEQLWPLLQMDKEVMRGQIYAALGRAGA